MKYLKKHQHIHDDIYPFECEECQKKFKRSDRFKEHLRVHTGEKVFICDKCDRGFSLLWNLKKYKKNHKEII